LPHAGRWYSLHPDERQIFASVISVNFFEGDFNPNFYNYPSLFIYATYIVHLLAGAIGLFAPPGNELWPFLREVLFSGRVLTAVLGAATAPLVFLTARNLLRGSQTLVPVLFAGSLMALAPGHVQHSHFATVDVPATFFVALSLWLSTRALVAGNSSSARDLILAALAAGLAAATKYNTGVVFVAPLCATLLLTRPTPVSNSDTETAGSRMSLLKTVPQLIGAAALGFLIGCPGAVLYFHDFWNLGFAYELFVHPRQGSGEIFQQTGNGWLYHLTFNLPFVLTTPLLIVALIGIYWTVRNKLRLVAPLLIFAAFYFLSLGFSQVRFMRYVLPLVPLLCVFAAVAAEQLLRFRPAAARVSLAGVTLLAAIGASNVLVPLAKTDPRDAAARWMQASSGTNEQVTTIGLANNPWFWTPPFSPMDAAPGSPPNVLPQSLVANPRYNLIVVGSDATALTAAQPNYVALNEFEWRDQVRLNNPQYVEFLATLERDYKLAQTFKTAIPLALPGRDFVAYDYLYTNPEVRIYQRK
jgi:4-amino-4-deoxy-L-arabinose transferase-like glycosyltransferase